MEQKHKKEKLVKVWDESCKTSKEEYKFYIKLEESNHGDINLVICDKQGNRVEEKPNIITIDLDYKVICIHSHIDRNFPLKTNYKDEPQVVSVDDLAKYHNERMFNNHMIGHFEEMIKREEKENRENATIN